ncbi:hypothetical protein NMY22_g15651 [Coprinellus aureogranulatus]|nr:hypothetical protein NMY22_g15651 [Coprinellus aureogranulatus]
MPDRRHPHPHPEPHPIPQDMTDDYYHYYMASQKRVSRWISQTQRELETATPMPVPSLFDVSLAQSAAATPYPNQVILTNQDWRSELQQDLRDPAPPNVFKTRLNYTLAGQGQALRDQKNQVTMAHFIKSLAVSMNAPGLTPRATTLFNQAKAIGYVRWGSRARTVAGACLSLALREASRPDSIHDIAILLRCSPHLLSRTFISLASALKITTLTVDPSVYIATLQSYLTTILQEDDQVVSKELPASLRKSIGQLSFVSVSNTAQSLGRVLSRNCTSDTTTSKSSAASTACALFMLSLESESRDTLEGLGDLAKCLAARCHIGKGVVMSQYKVIQDQVADLIEKVPWLEGYRQKKGRAKVSKRLVVARGLKDVIRFNEEIFQNTLLPEIHLELSSDEKGDFDDQVEGEKSTEPGGEDDRPAKKRKIHHSLNEASSFLLNPFSRSLASTKVKDKRTSTQAKSSLSRLPLTSYVLSTSSLTSVVSHRPPTRLQLLAASRGGSSEDAIRDDELFAEGELEGMLRSPDEVELMRRVFQFDEDDESDEGGGSNEKTRAEKTVKKKAQSTKGKDVIPSAKRTKIDLEAFTKFMQDADDANSEADAEGETDYDDDDHHASLGFSLLGLDSTLGFEEDAPIDYVAEDGENSRSATISRFSSSSKSGPSSPSGRAASKTDTKKSMTDVLARSSLIAYTLFPPTAARDREIR